MVRLTRKDGGNLYSLNKFLDQVQTIVNEQPKYKTGGTGNNGVCDCIGLVMGAMYRLGKKRYGLHSSNYFARSEQVTLNPISSASELFDGEVLYTARNPGDSGYDLNDRYISNPNFATGDLTDYYHAGVVLSANPLVIVECTSVPDPNASGIVITNKLNKKWKFGGRLKNLDYDGYTGRTNGSENTVATIGELQDNTCKISVPAGTSTANMRAKSTKDSALIVRVPDGQSVLVTEDANAEYAKVRWEDVAKNKVYNGYVLRSVLALYADENGNVVEESESIDDDTLTDEEKRADTLLDDLTDGIRVDSHESLEELIYKAIVSSNASVAFANILRERAYVMFPQYASDELKLESLSAQIKALDARLKAGGL